jgi:hypothetical protein
MADANVRINIQTASLEALNTQLATLQAQIAKIPIGSAEFKKLSAEIRRVDAALSSANNKLKGLDVGAVAGDIAKLGGAVASASALFKQFGAEGSDSQKAIQGALETTNTILGAGAIAEGVASAARLASTAITEAATVAQGAYAAVVGTSTGALKAFRIALAATGVGAAILLITTLAERFDLFGTKAKENGEKAEKALTQYQKRIEILGVSTEIEFKKQIKQAILSGKTDEEVNALKLKLRKESFDAIQAEGAKLKLSQTKEREELIKLEKVYQAEIDALEIDAYKKSEERRKKAAEEEAKAQEAAAQKRRERIKADLNEIISLVKDESLTLSLALQETEQKTVEAALKRITESPKDLKIALQELRDEGKGAYADLIQSLVNDGQKLEEIEGILKKVFGKQAQDILTNFTNEGLTNLTNGFDKLVKDLTEYEKDIKKFGVGFGDVIIEGFTRVTEEGVKSTSSLIFLPSIEEITTQLNGYLDAIDEFYAEERTKVNQLRANNKITEDELKIALENIGKSFVDARFKFFDFRDKTVQSLADLTTQVLTTNLSKITAAAQDEIVKLETQFYKDSAGVSAKTRLKLEEDFQKKKRDVIEQELKKELVVLDKAEEDIKKLRQQGLISVQDAALRIEEIERKKAVIQRDLAKGTTEVIISEEQKRVEAAQDFLQVLEKVKEAYNQVANAIQALGNIIADQAELQDLRFQEEIELVDERYQREFDLIDEREKKFEDELSARDGKLTTEEKKRRAFAKERADLEKQQQADLADLENQRANAAADAAIKAAEVNFALGVGQIVISTAEAVAKSVAASPLTFGLPFSAFAIASGAIQLAAANSAKGLAIAQANASRPGASGAKNVRVSKAEGGLISGPGNGISDSIPANLSNGEFVVNSNATQRFLPLLNQINQSGLQGGNAVNPASGDNQMVALLQDIRQQLAQPNRSYVVATDIEEIKNKQTYINRRSNVL